MYENLLQQTGLSQNQAVIYELLLKEGALPAGKITQKTPLKRGIVYKTLDELIAKELIEKREKPNQVAKFVALHPNQLRDLIDYKEDQLNKAKKGIEQVLPQLISEYNLAAGKPGVKFYEGLEGIKIVAADSLNATGEILSYLDSEAIEKYIKDINLDYVKKREVKGIFKKILTVDTSYARNHFQKINKKITEVRLMDEKIPAFQTVMQIYNNKISYITLAENNIIGVIIEDKFIYNMHSAIFEYNWRQAKAINSH